ncbi:MAG: TaqI-like C-terminal specificity domain-containing protein, partial [Bacteroidales bacterium]
NEESIEIAKLSLWLRTAQKGRKLNRLNNNIKCGNSLIDDPEVVGEKAFNWQNEFPEIFANGGFDVVIGNPPYVNINTMPEIHEFLKNKYTEIHTGYNDLMYYFLFKGIDILKTSGLYGVITSNYFIGNDYADKLRLFLNKHVETIVNFEKTLVFEDANVHTTLVFAKKETHNKLMQFYTYTANNPLRMVDLSLGYTFCELERNKQSNKWLIANNQNQNIIDKIHIDATLLNEICEIEKGSTSGKNSIFTISYEFAENQYLEKELLRKNVKNGDIDSYTFTERGFYLIYTDNNTNMDDYPKISSYLNQFKEELSSRNEASKGLYSWFRLERPRNKQLFDSPEKLIVPYRATRNRFAYDNQQFFNDGGDIRILALKQDVQFSIKYLLPLLNSKLLDWFYGFIGKAKGNAREYFNKPLSEIPIKNIPLKDQQAFILLADTMLKFKTELKQKRNRFLKRLTDNFNIDKINSGIQNFADNDFKTLLKELSKLKIQLSLSQQDEWEDYFNTYKSEINQLQSEIEKTVNEIDRMVYELYGLTDKEIRIVEGTKA